MTVQQEKQPHFYSNSSLVYDYRLVIEQVSKNLFSQGDTDLKVPRHTNIQIAQPATYVDCDFLVSVLFTPKHNGKAPLLPPKIRSEAEAKIGSL